MVSIFLLNSVVSEKWAAKKAKYELAIGKVRGDIDHSY